MHAYYMYMNDFSEERKLALSLSLQHVALRMRSVPAPELKLPYVRTPEAIMGFITRENAPLARSHARSINQ